METNADFRTASSYAGWRTSWHSIVAGTFDDGAFDGLCFYDAAAGVGEFYGTDGRGGLTLLQTHAGWRTSWHQIVPGHFGGSRYTDLLFYDRSAGHGEFYTTDGHGEIALLRLHDDWRRSWDRIVPINHWVGGTTGLLSYDRSAGVGEFYSTDGRGEIALLRAHGDWRKTWQEIVPLRIGTGTYLLFYEQGTGHAELYAVDLQGNIQHRRTFSNWRRTWSLIQTVSVRTAQSTGLFFYDRTAGHAEFYTIDGAGSLSLVKQYPGLRRSWSLMVGGAWGGVFGDLLLYDRAQGEAELLTLDPWPMQRLEGYVSRESVAPAQSLGIHVRSDVGPFRLEILRRGLTDTSVASLGVFADVSVDIPIDAAENGCRWPESASFKIPFGAASGLYVVRVSALRGGESYEIPFVVRPTSRYRRGRRPRILFAIAASTYEAYCWWGGRSLYGHGLLGGAFGWQMTAAFQVSTQRPYLSPDDFVKPKFQLWELPFIHWLERNGIEVDYCTSYDLHSNSTLLNRYDLLVCLGHDEYWSWEMRDHVEQFVAAGNSVAILSGNSVWWQVRFDEPGAMACYKSKDADPANASPATRSRVTVNWWDAPVNRPEAWMTGVSYKYSGPLIFGGNGVGEAPLFEVVREHPLLANTGLSKGGKFGSYSEPRGRTPWGGGIYSVIGYEGDARPLPPDQLNWRATWDLIVAADRNVAVPPGLLFYDKDAGEGELYDVTASGSLALRKLHQGWRQSWDKIICGMFGTTNSPDFLFYDRGAGVGEFYASDSNGEISLLSGYDDWRRSWDQIVPGNFAGSGFTDLLFYDRAAGVGEFYQTDGAGRILLLQTHEGWRQSWDLIVPGNFGGNSRTDLLFYDRAAGVGEFYATDGNGGIQLLGTNEGWRSSWDQILSLQFSGASHGVLLFYDRSAGVGEFYATDGAGGIHLLATHLDWRTTWRHIVPLKLDNSSTLYLLFYEDETGYAELYSVTSTGRIALRHAYANPAFTLIAKAMFQGPPDGDGVVPPIIEYSSLGVLRIGVGNVFTASTTDWSFGLSQSVDRWSPLDQITANLLHQFGGAPEIVRPITG